MNKMADEAAPDSFRYMNCNDPAQKYLSMPSMGNQSSICYGETFVDTKKWSENASDMPLTAAYESSVATQDEKIRRHLFENSYFTDFNAARARNIDSSAERFTASSAEQFSDLRQVSEQQNGEWRRQQFGENGTVFDVEVSVSSAGALVEVTLANHSIHSSFKPVTRTSTERKPTPPAEAELEPSPTPSQSGEQENLLTSEKTHFCPIKQTYPDGYTFEISDEWDEIRYERSASGTMYVDSEVYREYYVYDEEGNGGRLRVKDSPSARPPSGPAPFVLKYCVKQNEKSVQTDSVPPKLSAIPPGAKVLRARPQRKDMRHRESRHVIADDAVDLLGADFLNMDEWTMAENQKKCNSNIEKVHALWEHCDACSNDVVSMPANRLLRDELSAEGDEIMSDLKYMQNLYIGNDWEEEDAEMVVDSTVDDDDGLVTPLKANAGAGDDGAGASAHSLEKDDDDGYSDAQTKHIYYNVNKLISDLLQPEKAMTLVQAISEKCNSRIARLPATVKPGNAERIDGAHGRVRAVGASDACTGSLGGLWASNDNSIWRKDHSNEQQSIWSNGSAHDANMNDVKGACIQSQGANQWEHANLEKIWAAEVEPAELGANYHRKRIKEVAKAESGDLQQAYTISVDDKEALQKFIDLANNQSSVTVEHLDHSHVSEALKCVPNIKNRHDRKRRHSATSENVFETSVYVLRPRDRIAAQKQVPTEAECDSSTSPDGGADPSSMLNFITCKYWTTDPACFNDKDNDNNNNENINVDSHLPRCFMPFDQVNMETEAALHPTSILKHVAAMVARPLTR